MRRLFNIYILVLLALGVACQRVDLPDNPQVNQPAELPVGEIGSKVTITFSTADFMGPETRGVLNPEIDDPTLNIETLHLIVFDENGMLVEVCEARELGDSDHVDTETGEVHQGGRHYTVTLTVTDQPRTIHYVANCPVDQVVYGHETSIIGNMFVDRNGSEGAETKHEVSYWARIEVPYILVEEKSVEQDDGTKKIVVSLVDEIKGQFIHVPLLRNYAEITVTDQTDDTFYFEGFTVYNLLNRGTVAPYNSNTQQFQSFFERGGENITNYSYPKMYKEFGYEGHALTSAELITDFIRNDDGSVKIYKSDEPFYVYERKVSVMTDEEEKWRESPPHIIIKGRYNNGQSVENNAGKTYYYKMDLVYTEGSDGNEEIKYYNILRNFKYQFNLTKVHDVGYETLEEAVAGAAGNNISGSSTTSKMTNISDSEGRLWVSYTDITLVTGEPVTLRYKYAPNFYTNENDIQNDNVNFQNIVGDVITGIEVADTDIISGEWKDWREVTIRVNAPSDIIRQQILYLKTDNVNLNRQIRHTLRKKLKMQVECTPKVKPSIKEEVQVDIKLPIGMTEDMFPLELNMETWDRTLSPDAEKNTIPVNTGLSIIDGRREEQSYYYTVTIPTFDAYKALPNDGNMEVYSTYWLTNMAENASTFYVDNKYFDQGSDSWENYVYEFSGVSCSPSAVGKDADVTIKFTMANGAINTPVTISLEGMTYNGATEFTYTPTPSNQSVSLTCKTTTDTDPVSFTLDADNYNIAKAEGTRLTYQFDGKFVGATSLAAEAGVEVDFTFEISEEAFDTLKSLYPDAGDAGVPMFVTLDRLQPADNQLVYSQAKAVGDRYIYRIKNAGTQTIKLATTEDFGGPCTVTLQADYFDPQIVEILQSNIVTYAGTINVTDAKTFDQLQTDRYYTSSATYSIKVAGKDVVTNEKLTSYKTSTTTTGNTNRKYYITGINSFTIENVLISGEGINENTQVTIEITITANNKSQTVTYSKKINELGLSKQ